MSHAGVSRTLIVLVAATSLVSCGQEAQSPAQNPPDPTGPIQIKFTCDGGNAIGLTDRAGVPAWSISQDKNTDISWEVAPNVTINSIAAKTPANPLPIDVDPNEHGGSGGKKYKAKIKNIPGTDKHYYQYSIDVTCHSQTGFDLRLVIDPQFIVPR